MFHVVDYRDLRVAVQDEIAVHTVYAKILRNGALGRGETLCYCCSAVDASRARGVPEGARVGEEVGFDVVESG